ncbi:molybdopterin-dependent oxidoreductase [Pseudomonas sp.]|uniref:molybdopterin-dependent oxidoreductase n=1 Tax=Pseudomonas sp. TaxID=306 RepID=UPI002734021C|nr:molybdopterin-dependent oxidoreductase [Pseudomonas sp.]MDP3813608.1 molybdopterin-dependent oxidoreductase [Pseudomonas sp.]
MYTSHLSLRVFVLSTLLIFMGQALALDKPAGTPVLSLSGQIDQANTAQQQAVFDMQMLRALPQHSFTTQTPWYPQPVKFTGPLLRDVLAAAGSKGASIVAIALNDYRTEIPVQDTLDHEVIVATLMNDKPMPVREKGPLFIVYPFDSKAGLQAATFYNRSAWQLRALQIK